MITLVVDSQLVELQGADSPERRRAETAIGRWRIRSVAAGAPCPTAALLAYLTGECGAKLAGRLPSPSQPVQLWLQAPHLDQAHWIVGRWLSHPLQARPPGDPDRRQLFDQLVECLRLECGAGDVGSVAVSLRYDRGVYGGSATWRGRELTVECCREAP